MKFFGKRSGILTIFVILLLGNSCSYELVQKERISRLERRMEIFEDTRDSVITNRIQRLDQKLKRLEMCYHALMAQAEIAKRNFENKLAASYKEIEDRSKIIQAELDDLYDGQERLQGQIDEGFVQIKKMYSYKIDLAEIEKKGLVYKGLLPIMSGKIFHHVINIGQSNAVGGGLDPALSKFQSFNNFKITRDLERLSPLIEPVTGLEYRDNVETHVSSMTSLISGWYKNRFKKDYIIVASNSGVGSAPCTNIKKHGELKGKESYLHSMLATKRLLNFCIKNDIQYHLDSLVLIHGQSDCWADNIIYKEQLLELWIDYNRDLNELIQDARKDKKEKAVPMILTQLIGSCNSVENGMRIKNAQLEAARDYAYIYLAGPTYQLPIKDDNAHLTNIGYQQLGEMISRVLFRVVVEKKEWIPLSPKEIKLVGSMIVIHFHVPFPPLQVDGGMPVFRNGFDFYENVDSPAKIIKVDVEPESVVIHLDKVPQGTIQKISYAKKQSNIYPHGAGNIRDSGDDNGAAKYPTNNYLVSFEKEIQDD